MPKARAISVAEKVEKYITHFILYVPGDVGYTDLLLITQAALNFFNFLLLIKKYQFYLSN